MRVDQSSVWLLIHRSMKKVARKRRALRAYTIGKVIAILGYLIKVKCFSNWCYNNIKVSANNSDDKQVDSDGSGMYTSRS